MLNKAMWLAPLIFFELYLTFIGALFFFGPWPWIVKDPLSIGRYLILANFFIAAGYALSWLFIGSLSDEDQSAHLTRGTTWLRSSVIASWAMAVPTSLARTGHIFPDIMVGLNDPGSAYLDGLQFATKSNPYVSFEYIRLLLSPLLVALPALTIVFWRPASMALRVAASGAIVFYLAIFIARGQNKGLADMLVLLPFFVVAAGPFSFQRLSFGRVFAAGGFAAILLFFVGYYFSLTQAQRSGGTVLNGTYAFGTITLLPFIPVWMEYLPTNIEYVIVALARYLGQGYQALALTFDTPHESTLGVGNSMFLARNADRLFNTDFFTTHSLPGLLEQELGWRMYGLWHSIYPWLASDVGYGGALIVVGGFAFLLGLSWGKSITTKHPLWLAMLTLMLTLFFYIPANNQIFQSAETTVAFVLILALLFLQRVLSLGGRSTSRTGNP